MTVFEIAALAFIAGWLVRCFATRRECGDCFNRRMQRQEWDRTAHLPPYKGGHNDLSRWKAFGGDLDRPPSPTPMKVPKGDDEVAA